MTKLHRQRSVNPTSLRKHEQALKLAMQDPNHPVNREINSQVTRMLKAGERFIYSDDFRYLKNQRNNRRMPITERTPVLLEMMFDKYNNRWRAACNEMHALRKALGYPQVKQYTGVLKAFMLPINEGTPPHLRTIHCGDYTILNLYKAHLQKQLNERNAD